MLLCGLRLFQWTWWFGVWGISGLWGFFVGLCFVIRSSFATNFTRKRELVDFL